MTLFLKQSTAIDIRMGPYVDATDGFTPETGLTIGAADQAEVLKANGAATVAMTGTFAAVSSADGWYDYTCATTDVDTVGEVVFALQDSSVARPAWTRGYVLEEAVYDAWFGASATPLADIADAVLDEDMTGHQTQGTLGQAIGDPASDATTIYQAVATDAAGDNVAIDGIAVKAETALIVADTVDIQGRLPAALVNSRMDSTIDATGMESGAVSNLLTTQMTEAYAADGAAPTLAQALMMIQQMLGDFAISGTTLTVRKVDGATTAATFTLDSATTPTDLTRAT